jgi:hypothetical protein
MDLLRTAANAFIKLSAFEYRLVLSSGRNKPLDIIKINFIAQDLFHILGGKRYLMLKEKKKGNISCVLFKHPNYVMEQSFLKKQLEDAEASIREEGTISADDLEKELGV